MYVCVCVFVQSLYNQSYSVDIVIDKQFLVTNTNTYSDRLDTIIRIVLFYSTPLMLKL